MSERAAAAAAAAAAKQQPQQQQQQEQQYPDNFFASILDAVSELNPKWIQLLSRVITRIYGNLTAHKHALHRGTTMMVNSAQQSLSRLSLPGPVRHPALTRDGAHHPQLSPKTVGNQSVLDLILSPSLRSSAASLTHHLDE